jgi:Ca2+-binding EF-hand superfamily protein
MRGGMRQHGMQMLKKADSDGDGAVTRAEFDAAVAARFAHADSNGDGSISAEERKAAHAGHREHRRQ